MTRKDYERIAAAVKAERDMQSHEAGRVAVDNVAERLAATLNDESYRFDVYKFLKACGTR